MRPFGAYETVQTWDTCLSAIVYGGELEESQTAFEAWCQRSLEGEKPVTSEIKKLVATQFVDQLLTESGTQPLDWPEINRRVLDPAQNASPEDAEPGFWVDVNQAVPAEHLSPDLESLKKNLPDDLGSGLNWSPEKTFLFLVTVLSPPPLVTYTEDIPETDSEAGEPVEEPTADLDPAVADLPEMRDKETAALVEARNSVVAAWLWRRFAAQTRLAANNIHLSSLCALFAIKSEPQNAA